MNHGKSLAEVDPKHIVVGLPVIFINNHKTIGKIAYIKPDTDNELQICFDWENGNLTCVKHENCNKVYFYEGK